MKLITSRRAYIRWLNNECIDDRPEPIEYPCFAYKAVIDWGMQHETAMLLYKRDIISMLFKLQKR